MPFGEQPWEQILLIFLESVALSKEATSSRLLGGGPLSMPLGGGPFPMPLLILVFPFAAVPLACALVIKALK